MNGWRNLYRSRLTTPEAAVDGILHPGASEPGTLVHAQRAEALIAIAHPAFHDELFEFAVRNHYLDRSSREPALATG